MSRSGGLCVLAGVLTLYGPAPPLAAGYREGPPPAHTGGFAEHTCQTCHFDNDVNDAAGSLRLEGVPSVFAPDERYRITVTLARPGLAAAGFQLSVRVAEGAEQGRQAGMLSAVDHRGQTTRDPDTGIIYAQHTEAGAPASDAATWTVEWTPGGLRVPIAVHVSANAANDDASEFGDFIYTGTAQSVPALPDPAS